jgi:hypothetical protein
VIPGKDTATDTLPINVDGGESQTRTVSETITASRTSSPKIQWNIDGPDKKLDPHNETDVRPPTGPSKGKNECRLITGW